MFMKIKNVETGKWSFHGALRSFMTFGVRGPLRLPGKEYERSVDYRDLIGHIESIKDIGRSGETIRRNLISIERNLWEACDVEIINPILHDVKRGEHLWLLPTLEVSGL
jgi:hypothetical protein